MKRIVKTLLLMAPLIFGACHTVVVGPDKSEPKNWTVVVYMPGDNNLGNAALNDLKEMQQAKFDAKSMNLLVLSDVAEKYAGEGNGGTKLYSVNGNIKELDCDSLGVKSGRTGNLNMADAKNISRLLDYAQEEFPADHYGFIVWGHGSGWRNVAARGNRIGSDYGPAKTVVRAVAFDDSSCEYMTLPNLAEAVRNSFGERKVDFIGFDTCFGAEMEVLYELKDVCHWFCGTEGLEDGDGWNYEKWLSECNFEEAESGKEIGMLLEKQFVDEGDTSFCLFNMEHSCELFDTFDAFCVDAAKIIKTEEDRERIINNVRSKVLNYYVSGVESDLYVDVVEFSKLFVKENNDLSTSAVQLTKVLEKGIVSSRDYRGDRLPVGVYFCTVDEMNSIKDEFSDFYVHGAEVEGQSEFVKDSVGYVPSVNCNGSVLDRLFFTTYFNDKEGE